MRLTLVALKCACMDYGALCAVIPGRMKTPVLSADNLDSLPMVMLWYIRTMAACNGKSQTLVLAGKKV